jgi:hypothetical protein
VPQSVQTQRFFPRIESNIVALRQNTAIGTLAIGYDISVQRLSGCLTTPRQLVEAQLKEIKEGSQVQFYRNCRCCKMSRWPVYLLRLRSGFVRTPMSTRFDEHLMLIRFCL